MSEPPFNLPPTDPLTPELESAAAPSPGSLAPGSPLLDSLPAVLSEPPHVNSQAAGGHHLAKQLFDRVAAEIAKIYVGQDELVLTTLVALFSSGHVLIESVPGLGKTLFVRTLGRVLGCQFGRIQFTADLMPSDITGRRSST